MSIALKELRVKVLESIRFPLLFLAVCWLVFFTAVFFDLDFHKYGVSPREWKGLLGILLMPFLHGDLEHILNNSFGILTLTTLLFFFYKSIAYKVFWLCFFISGFWTWSIAYGGYHIGASAIIYALFGFLVPSGMIRRDTHLLAITFLVIFAHSGIVWGIFPTKPGISWEGHLAGFLAGIVLAIYYRKEGPQKKKIIINDDDTFNEMRFGKYYWDEEKRKEELEKEYFKIIYNYKKEGD